MVAVLLRRKARREVDDFMEVGLLGLERFRLNEGVDELVYFVVAGFRVCEHGVGEVLVNEAEGAAESVGDEGFGEALGELLSAQGDGVTEAEVVVEFFFTGKSSAGVDEE